MMTLDEAIIHCEEQAEIEGICDCAAEHAQLAEWLKELKRLRQWKKDIREKFEEMNNKLDPLHGTDVVKKTLEQLRKEGRLV